MVQPQRWHRRGASWHTALSAFLQYAVDTWLADAPEARARCAALAGSTVAVELTDLGVELCLRPNADGIAVSVERTTEADARIRARSVDLLRLSTGEGATGAPGRLHIEGDAELAQAVRDLMRSVPFDPEERLARLIGDIPAHQAGRMARGVHGFMRDTAWRIAAMGSEFLQYETRDLVRPDEVAAFVAEVDALRDDLERAAARLDAVATHSVGPPA
jgi:ubiquinone biosynthesis accessory factor UbiJ